jgi:hypothetical protein
VWKATLSRYNVYRKRIDNNTPKKHRREKAWIPQWCRGKQKKHSHVFFFCCVLFFTQSVARHHHHYYYYPYDALFFLSWRTRYLFSMSNLLCLSSELTVLIKSYMILFQVNLFDNVVYWPWDPNLRLLLILSGFGLRLDHSL